MTNPDTRPQSDLTREGVARVIDPKAMRTVAEEIELVRADIVKAFRRPEEVRFGAEEIEALSGLAADNVAGREADRQVALAKADAILAMVPGGGGWQAIESAPREAPELLLHSPGDGTVTGFYVSSRDFTGWTTGWVTANGRDVGYNEIKPTLWTDIPPLPTAPKEGDQ